MKKEFVKFLSQLLHSSIHQVMRYFCVFIVSPFFLLWTIFFLKKTDFFWSLVYHSDSIILDTSDKPTVGFFLKITSPSKIILSVSLDELNSINLLLKS